MAQKHVSGLRLRAKRLRQRQRKREAAAAAAAEAETAAAALAAAEAAAAGGGGVVNHFSRSLYVGNLDLNVTDQELYLLFHQVGDVDTVKVCKDLSTDPPRSLGHGYVNYFCPQDAARAMKELNFTLVNDKPISVMYRHSDRHGAANIIIKNLDKAIDDKALHETFLAFGKIMSWKIATDPSGQSQGHGFVQFENDESAQTAINNLNGTLINDKQVYVGHFLRKHERETAMNRTKFNNVYVKNLAESTTEEDLEKIFGEYGPITSVSVMRDGNGKSKCFGFVNFENADDAANAVEALNGKKVDEKEWYVGKAQKKSERELELKSQFEQTVQGVNLYVKKLDGSIDDGKLKELFSEFGTITSCKVMRDPCGVSKCSGFVAFSTPEEASRALAEMNGKMVVSKPLYVALAQRKEERRAKQMLGDKLYPLVDQLEHEYAAKVTSMLLEMDQTEVLHLLESPDALKAKVAEAMDVLRNVAAQQQATSPADHLASLYLNDNLVS